MRTAVIIIILLLASLSSVLGSGLLFNAKVDYQVGNNPTSVCVADFDGDGNPDLAVANSGDNTISILRNNGNGTFAIPVNYSLPSGCSCVFAADFDGDGKPDLAVAGGSTVSILRNNGNGTFAGPISYAVATSASSIFAADLNGDGKPDLAVAGGSTVTILMNNGNGTFASPVSDSAGYDLNSIFAADFDGDGKLDLVVSSSGSGAAVILRNNGDGTFASPVSYGAGVYTSCVVAADFSGDKRPDLAVTSFGSHGPNPNVDILLNNGDGTFRGPTYYPVGSRQSSVISADLDGDGVLDLAVANFSDNTVSLLRGNGDGTFGNAVNYGLGNRPWSLVAADFDRDGRPDIAVTNASDNTVSILINKTTGVLRTIRVPADQPTIQAGINAAWNGDTVLVAPGEYAEHVKVFTSVTLKSVAGPGETTIDGLNQIPDSSASCITIVGVPNITVDGFAIRGGRGMMRHDSTAARGGGIYVGNSQVHIENCSIQANAVTNGLGGGGVFSDSSSNLIMDSCTLQSCSVQYNMLTDPSGAGIFGGGAVLAFGLRTTLRACHFLSNSVSVDLYSPAKGGGVALYQGSNHIVGCTFSGNSLLCGMNNESFSGGGAIFATGSGNIIESTLVMSTDVKLMSAYSGETFLGGALCVIGDSTLVRNLTVRGVSCHTYEGFTSAKEAPKSPMAYPSTVIHGGGCYISGIGTLLEWSSLSSCGLMASDGGTAGGYASTCGGGAYLSGSGVSVNCTFADNSCSSSSSGYIPEADAGGGAIYVMGNFSVTDCLSSGCTIAGTTYGNFGVFPATLYGGGIYADSSVRVTNSDVWNCTSPNVYGTTWVPGLSGNLERDPMFCGLVDSDLTLRSNSPCLPPNNTSGVQIGAFGEGCLDAAPVITSKDTASVNEDASFIYHATATDPDGPSLIWSYIKRPSWLTCNADSIYGTPHYPVHDTSFIVIASDGFLADSQVVNITVHQLTPEVRVLRVDSDTLNLHVVRATPQINWHYYDPTGSSPQTQFVVAVGTDTDWTYAEMWNPAPFTSPDSFVQYAGIALVRGQTYYLRAKAYNGTRWSPWKNGSFRMNSKPSIPVAKQPINDQVVGSTPILWVADATDAEGDPLFYDFDGYHDSACASGPAISLTKVLGTPDSTGGHTPAALSENCRYHWRSRSFDGYEYSDWSAYSTFYVNGVDEPPSAVTLITPPTTDGKPTYTLLPTLFWTAATDPDPFDTVRYKVELSLSPNFSLVFSKDSLLADSFKVQDSLQFGTHYWWRVSAIDKTNLVTMCQAPANFWTWTLGDLNGSHVCDLGDLSMMVSYLTGGGAIISPKMVGDLNEDCRIDLSDLSRLVSYLTGGGAQLMPGCQGPGQVTADSIHVAGRMEFHAARVNSSSLTK